MRGELLDCNLANRGAFIFGQVEKSLFWHL
jgi:hypothetical protein